MSSDRPTESFASLFEQDAAGKPRRRSVRVGDTHEVLVVQVGKDTVFVEIDGRTQGFVEASDLRAPDQSISCSVGDRLRAHVVGIDKAGIRLTPTVEAAVAAGATVSLGAGDGAEAPRVAVGQVVSGAVERVENYGVFLQMSGTKGRAGRASSPPRSSSCRAGRTCGRLSPSGRR